MSQPAAGHPIDSPAATAAVSDAALMAAISAKDDRALAALYDRYSPVVFALCLRALPRVAAEEVMVDLFFELWDRADRYDPARGDPITYLMRVARSRILDKLRAANARKREAGTSPDSQAIAAAGAGPLQDAQLAENRVRVAAALAQLPPAQRDLVELAFYEAMSHSEIADKIGEPLGTVKSRIRQGLIRLRDLLVDPDG